MTNPQDVAQTEALNETTNAVVAALANLDPAAAPKIVAATPGFMDILGATINGIGISITINVTP